MSLLQQRGLSVTEVVVEVGGKVLLDTERCPSELIIICAPSTPRFHIRKLQHEPSLSHRPRKKPRQADCVNGYTPAHPSPPISWPTVLPSVFNIFQSSPDYLDRRKTVT